MSDQSKIITNNLNQEFKQARLAKDIRGVQDGREFVDNKTITDMKTRFRRHGSVGGQVTSVPARVQSPFYQGGNANLPLNRIDRNQWCRYYYRHEPYVKSAIDLHSQFPISDFENTCKDKAIKNFFDEMVFDEINIIGLLLEIGLDYWKLGDAFPMGKMDKDKGTWEKFICLNPDYVDIQTNIFAKDPLITLVPDNDLKQIVSGGPSGPLRELFRQLSPEVRSCVGRGENIPLSPTVVSQLSNKAAGYEVWGTPLIQNVFKVLLYKDRLREAQRAIADRFVTPLRIFKLGTPGQPQPSDEELEDFRNLLEQLDNDPAPVIVYHSEVAVEGTDFASRLLPLAPEFQWIKEELLVGLCTSESFLTGDGSNYSSNEIALESLRRKYLTYRNILTRWIMEKVYRPIAELQEFYEPEPRELVGRYRSKKKDERRLIIPEVTWFGKDMLDEDAARQLYLELQSRGLISVQTMLPKFSLDYETEMENMKMEAQQMETGEFSQGSGAGLGLDLGGDVGGLGGETPPEGLDSIVDDAAADRPISPDTGASPAPLGQEMGPNASNRLRKVYAKKKPTPGYSLSKGLRSRKR